jgi:hypothetical protein
VGFFARVFSQEVMGYFVLQENRDNEGISLQNSEAQSTGASGIALP